MKLTGGCGLLLFIFNVIAGGVCTQYVINVLVPLISHHAVDAPFWPCALAGLFFGSITIPMSVMVWLLKICGVF